jgi:CheY-like chemotaxis protein
MVVDDDNDIRETLRSLLVEEGYQVSAHQNGRAALDALQALPAADRPDVILLDLMMPIMDGWDFRRSQLANPALAGIPVVLVTAAGLERVNPADFTEVLRKPLKLERVLDTLERLR